MLPLIHPGDKVVLEKSNSYKTDDVVAFRDDNLLIVHRIISTSSDGKYIITKGDNNIKPDRKIPSAMVLGKVSAVKRGGRIISLNHLYFAQSSFYLSELEKIAKVFKKNKIGWIILKGIVCHLYYTKAPPRRLYVDIDLLVKPKDFDRAREALRRLGFSKKPYPLFGMEFTNTTETTMLKNKLPFPIVVDLHRNLGIPFTKLSHLNSLYPGLKDFEQDLFKHTFRAKINRAQYPLLTKEYHLIYLILHWYRHNFEGAHHLDLIRSLMDSSLSFPRVRSIANKYGLSSVVFLFFLIAEKYFELKNFKNLSSGLHFAKWKRPLARFTVPFLSPLSTGTRMSSGIKRFFLAAFFSPLSFRLKMKLLFSIKTLRFIPLTLYAAVAVPLLRPGRRYVSEEVASHQTGPNSKTKSISL